MALETLKHIEQIGEFLVVTNYDIQRLFHESFSGETPDWWEWRSKHPIVIDHHNNVLSFKIQNKPVKEAGVNGCQVDTIIEAAKLILEGLNKNFPCQENELAINKLDMALSHLKERTRNREQRGVEGTSHE